MSYPQHQIDQIIELAEQGLTRKAVAERLDYSDGEIKHRWSEALRQRPLQNADKSEPLSPPPSKYRIPLASGARSPEVTVHDFPDQVGGCAGEGKPMRARGNQLPHSKLTPEKVREIRENRKGETARVLAERFGVHVNTIDRVRWGVVWGHIE